MKIIEIVVIDYGMGNLLSVRRALEHCGARVVITRDPKTILAASHVILPGVGAFARAMDELHRLELVEVIRSLIQSGVAFLGICLGMQLLLSESEEFGVTPGLNLIPGRVIPVPKQTIAGSPQKIPHIGWSALSCPRGEKKWTSRLLTGIPFGAAAYFIHSFMAKPNDSSLCLAECRYGEQSISAIIGLDNMTGCQFHPEKSGEMGLSLLRNFVSS